MLKRFASEPTVPLETRPVMCIRGGRRRAWLVLPTVQVHGRAFAALSSSMCWLHHLLGGYARRGLYQQPVASFVRECVAAFRVGEGPPSSNGLEPSETPGSTEEGDEPRGITPRKVGKAAILSASEDEGDGADDASESRSKTPQRIRRGRRARLGELVTRDLRGFELTYTVGRGPKVLIPTEGPFIERIVKDLQPRAREPGAPSAASSQETPTATEASSQDKGRVFWRGAGFQICYQDGDGKKRQYRAGLTMPKRGLTNEVLTAEEAGRTKEALLKKARREWNRLDQSGAPRFPA